MAGMALAASSLVAPAVVAAPTPTPGIASWVCNLYGQLGNDSETDAKVPVPVDTAGVLAGKTVTAVEAGHLHTCAVADGKAYCWGNNEYGQLGDNTTTNSKVPVAVDTTGELLGKTVTAITAGQEQTCALAAGKAYCWGSNTNGQLGNDSTTSSKVPVPVDTSGELASKTVTAITAGSHHTCAVAAGAAYCWGSNTNGQLGGTGATSSKVPAPGYTSGELASKTVTAITAGSHHTCAVAAGGAYCWGPNGDGQLGDNTLSDSPLPVAVDSSGGLAGKTVTAIHGGSFTRARWPPARRTAGATTTTGSSGTTAAPNRRCQLLWTPPECWLARP